MKRILKTEKKKDIPYSMYIDTHTHLHHRRFDKDRKQVLEQMEAVGIQAFLEVAMDLESNAVMREKLREAPIQVRFTAGVHPGAVEELPEKPDEVLQQIATYLKDENTVAVGEAGLDYCRADQAEIQAVQRVWFHRFIELARTEKLPLVLHIRDAHEDALQILREHGSEHRGVVHCFQGSWAEAEQYMKLGLYIGLGGLITREDKELEEVVRKLPLERILLETDSPYVTPKPKKGRNTPVNIPEIARCLARLRRVSAEEIAMETAENAKRLFGM